MRCPVVAAAVLVASLSPSSHAQVAVRNDRVGNTLQYVVPLVAGAMALHDHDLEGLKEFGLSFALAQGSTELLKHAVHEKRPNGSGYGFPSGHTSAVFVSAAFVHRRYGFDEAIPLYGLSVLTAYSRVHTRHHFTRDVVGGAAVGTGSAFLLTHEAGPGAQLTLDAQPRGLAVHVATHW